MAGRKESFPQRKARARLILAELKKLYPNVHCALEHKSALHLLVATILSAQSTDETVNKVTPVLFGRYPTALDLSDADRAELEEMIHSTGFFRQKAKSVQGTCSMIVERFDGRVPDTMEELVQLPGVARKTANVVLGTWFGKNDGVVVDTHVGRLSERLGLTWTGRDGKDAVRIENDLMQLLPRKDWTFAAHALIWHGRKVCSARKPDCERCTLSELCPSAFRVKEKGEAEAKSRMKRGGRARAEPKAERKPAKKAPRKASKKSARKASRKKMRTNPVRRKKRR